MNKVLCGALWLLLLLFFYKFMFRHFLVNFDKREEVSKPKRCIVASNPEVVGQIGSMISVDDLSSIDFETNVID